MLVPWIIMNGFLREKNLFILSYNLQVPISPPVYY